MLRTRMQEQTGIDATYFPTVFSPVMRTSQDDIRLLPLQSAVPYLFDFYSDTQYPSLYIVN
jgi:hypothetical protein